MKTSNDRVELDPRVHTEMLFAEGGSARGYHGYVDSGSVVRLQHCALMSHLQRPGRDGASIATSDAVCVRCERRFGDDPQERLCLPCVHVWTRECPTEFHVRFREWSGFRPDFGVNCSGCNLWLPARLGDHNSPSDEEPSGRYVAEDMEIGRRPMSAIKSALPILVAKFAPVTAAKLEARIGDSTTSIPAGDANVLYTTILVLERFLNDVALAVPSIERKEYHADFLENAWIAIRRIARALLHRD